MTRSAMTSSRGQPTAKCQSTCFLEEKVSTDKADTSSAVVQCAEEIDESAPHVRRRLPATRYRWPLRCRYGAMHAEETDESVSDAAVYGMVR